jgi:two-component system nitrogen regulation response regulator NtrX
MHEIARSAAMQDALGKLSAAVQHPGGVLVSGEPGSGRESFARAIHLANGTESIGSVERLLLMAMRGHRTDRPFVRIDSADRPGLEERLFGLVSIGPDESIELERLTEGSAIARAHGGTLYIRHLPEMPRRLQLRLARLLRQGEAKLLSDNGESRVEIAVRVVASAETVLDGDIVPELLRRLHIAIDVPPLRERRDDVPALVRCLLADLCVAAEQPPKAASRQAVELLSALPWPGNLGELEALLRVLVSHVPGRHIRLAHVLEYVRLDGRPAIASYTGTLKEARDRFERDYVAAVLDRHRGRMAEAAKALGLQRTNLYRKVRQLAVARRPRKRHVS